ncbi:signal transduction histidine kinase [Mycena floridula]|nr:signal transduction histidine kinase [Mycena floridula]
MSQTKTQTVKDGPVLTTAASPATESSVKGSQDAVAESKPKASPTTETQEQPDSASAEEPFEEDPSAIDMETFKQILDLDEEDKTYEFSREMVAAYFKQAAETFGNMDSAVKTTDLAKLSSLGHFLKGSSATLGVSKVQSSCEKIQNYGVLKNADASKDITKEDALQKITILLEQTKREYGSAEKWLRNWYVGMGIDQVEAE